MNVDTHEVWRDEQAIDLTATEFNLLRYLLENARRVISKSELLDNVWGFEFRGDPNIVETYISYLRKKIDDERAGADPHHPARRLHAPPAPRRMSLQKRLVAVVALLLVVGLVVADVVTYASVRSFLYGQADDTLAQNEALGFNFLTYAAARNVPVTESELSPAGLHRRLPHAPRPQRPGDPAPPLGVADPARPGAHPDQGHPGAAGPRHLHRHVRVGRYAGTFRPDPDAVVLAQHGRPRRRSTAPSP